MREEGASDAKVRPLSKLVSEPLSPSPFPASCERGRRELQDYSSTIYPLASELSIRVTYLVVMGSMHARASRCCVVVVACWPRYYCASSHTHRGGTKMIMIKRTMCSSEET
jgi:hypothetical protein